MDDVVAAIAAVGAWLLFSGPLLQAALELRNDTPRGPDGSTRPRGDSAAPGWSWLFPPAALWHHLRSRRRARRQQLQRMGDTAIRASLTFSNKATGWLLVASGALCIAIKETWEAGSAWEVPEFVRGIVVLGALVASCAVTAVVMVREGRLLIGDGPPGGRHGAQIAARAASPAAEDGER